MEKRNYEIRAADKPLTLEGVAVEVSRESGFTSGLIDYRALCIADGKPIIPGAFVKVEVDAA